MPNPGAEALLALPVLAACAAVHFNLRAEDGLSEALQMDSDPTAYPSVLGALQKVVATSPSDRSPRLLISRDPVPRAWVARAAGSPGRILLSQGLISTLGEEELRVVLRYALARLAWYQTPFRTHCASLAARLDRILPRGKLSPFVALALFMLYPIARFLGRQSEGLDLFQSPPHLLRFDC